jgi:GAF domain-containing protein
MSISTDTVKQIEAIIALETNNVANMANVCAHLYAEGGWHWVGFYMVDEKANELVLGPFQGPVACTRLKMGKGVCAKSWEENATVLVPNVHNFSGHIACSSLSNSELVVPIRCVNKVVGVLDIDSTEFDAFSSTHISIIEAVVKKLEEKWVG